MSLQFLHHKHHPLKGGGAYGVKTVNSHSRKGVAQVSVSDALQLMFMFGTFIVALLTLVVELIKNQQKK